MNTTEEGRSESESAAHTDVTMDALKRTVCEREDEINKLKTELSQIQQELQDHVSLAPSQITNIVHKYKMGSNS